MLYFNLIDPIISKNRNLTDEQIEEEIRKAFKMKGLILSDIKIVKMMDNSLDTGSSNIIPITLDKSGNISNLRSSVITKEEFTLLQKKKGRHVNIAHIKQYVALTQNKMDIHMCKIKQRMKYLKS